MLEAKPDQRDERTPGYRRTAAGRQTARDAKRCYWNETRTGLNVTATPV